VVVAVSRSDTTLNRVPGLIPIEVVDGKVNALALTIANGITLVAMDAMACGGPCMLSMSTDYLDIIGDG
jgi:hypothetical protein